MFADRSQKESRADRRRFIFSTGLFFLLVAALFGAPLLLGGRTLAGGDIVNQYLPYKALIRDQLFRGEFPHWNPLTFCGRPLQADVQLGIFYPPNILFWVLPLEWAFDLTTLFHFWIGAWGMALWMRRRVARAAAAWLAGALFMFSGYATTRLYPGIVIFHAAMSWLPWLLLCYDRLRESMTDPNARGGSRALTALVVVAALEILSGAPQMAFYSFLALGLYALSQAWRPRGNETSEDDSSAPPDTLWAGLAGRVDAGLPFRFGPVAALVGALALAAGICAVQLLPAAVLIGQSWDRAGGASWDYVTDGSLEPRMLLTLVAPRFFGDPRDEEHYWGGSVGYWETTAYGGALPLFLLAIFFVGRWGPLRRGWLADLSRERRRDAVRFEFFLVSILILGLVFAFGRHSLVFWFAYHLVPGFDRFRVPARSLLFPVFASAALSGWVLDRLAARDVASPTDSALSSRISASRSAPARPSPTVISTARVSAGSVILLIGLAGIAACVAFLRATPSIMHLLGMPFYPFEEMAGDPRAAAVPLLETQAMRSVAGFLVEWVVVALLLWIAATLASRKPKTRTREAENLGAPGRLGFDGRQSAVWLLTLFSLAVLFIYGRDFLLTERRGRFRAANYPRTERAAFLQNALRDGGRFLWFDSVMSYQVDQFQPELLTNRPLMYGLAGLRGYDPVNSRRYGLFMNQATGQPLSRNPRGFMFVPDTPAAAINWRLLALLDCRIALSYYALDNPPIEEVARWEFRENGGAPATLRAYRLKSPAGPAWLCAPLVVSADTPDEDVLAVLANPRFDPKSMAVVEQDPFALLAEDQAGRLNDPGEKHNPSSQGARPSNSPHLSRATRPSDGGMGAAPDARDTPRAAGVELLEKRSSSFVFRVSTPGRALLVLSQSWYPGWRAWVDGLPASVVPADVALCGVGVPAGEHTVEIAFRPRQFYQGAAITVASLLLLGLLALRRKRAC